MKQSTRGKSTWGVSQDGPSSVRNRPKGYSSGYVEAVRLTKEWSSESRFGRATKLRLKGVESWLRSGSGDGRQ